MVDQSRKNKVQYKENTTARTTTEKKPIDGFGMANDDVSLTVINFFSVAWRLRPGWISQTGRWAAVFSDTSTWTRLLANQRYRSHQFPSNRIKRCSLSLSLDRQTSRRVDRAIDYKLRSTIKQQRQQNYPRPEYRYFILSSKRGNQFLQDHGKSNSTPF